MRVPSIPWCPVRYGDKKKGDVRREGVGRSSTVELWSRSKTTIFIRHKSVKLRGRPLYLTSLVYDGEGVSPGESEEGHL